MITCITKTDSTTAAPSNLEAAIRLYLEQQHNYELWLAGEDADAALDAITSEAA